MASRYPDMLLIARPQCWFDPLQDEARRPAVAKEMKIENGTDVVGETERLEDIHRTQDHALRRCILDSDRFPLGLAGGCCQVLVDERLPTAF